MKRAAFARLTVLTAILGLTACSEPEPPRALTAPDASRISVSGTVAEAGRHSFTLDYGNGELTIEMDDWDPDADAASLLVGDEVDVYGYVDDDFYEKRKIEASSVYVRGLGTQFFASGADEEDFPPLTAARPGPQVTVTGSVGVVDPTTGTFTLHHSGGEVTVDVNELGYDPLDDEGYQQVKSGDRMLVRGAMDSDFFHGLELDAETVVTLRNRPS